MKTLFLDLVSGVSGDMLLSAAIDAGVPIAWLQEQIGRMKLPGLTIGTERLSQSGIQGAHMVIGYETPRAFRHLSQIEAVIEQGGYPDRVVSRCKQVLARLAKAEATVHGIAVDKVHFHEVGAVDTIVDIVGCVLCLEYLKIDKFLFGTITDGYGTVNAEHGTMPVPVPASAEMMRGFAVRIIEIPTELVTPTGCAILTALGRQVAAMPCGTIESVGYGCGTKVFAGHPNILRAILLDSVASGSESAVCVIESDMDHLSGEIMAFAAEECMASGALDVSWMPVFMKKGRPGYHLQVVCSPELREKLTNIIMVQTRTLGVRYVFMDRTVVSRHSESRVFLEHPVDEKVCTWKGTTFRKLEFEALAALARESGRPLIEIMDQHQRQ